MNCRKCKSDLPSGSAYCCYCGTKQEIKKRTKRVNGDGTVFKWKDNKYGAAVSTGYDNNGKLLRRYKYGFIKRADAIEWIDKQKNEPVQIQKSKTLKDLYTIYENGQMKEVSLDTQSHYRTAWNRWKPIENYTLDKIGIRVLQQTVDEAVSTHYPAKDMKMLCSILYKLGIAEGICANNLAQYIVLPDKTEKEPVALTEDEILQLWDDYEKGNKETGYYILLMHTGMMPGELRKLYPEQIDLDNKFIYGCGIKTKKRKETPIGIADILVPVIEDLMKQVGSDGRFYPHYEDFFYDEWKRIKKRAKINPEVTPYGCRHTFATILAQRNLNTETLREAMRHTQFTTTRRYIHKNVDAEVLDAVNKF